MPRRIPAMDALLDALLPDEKIRQDVAEMLWETGEDTRIEIDDDQWITVPANCELAISTKAYIREYDRLEFGRVKVMVAIGGVLKRRGAKIYPRYCFAYLRYNEHAQLITYDFLIKML